MKHLRPDLGDVGSVLTPASYLCSVEAFQRLNAQDARSTARHPQSTAARRHARSHRGGLAGSSASSMRLCTGATAAFGSVVTSESSAIDTRRQQNGAPSGAASVLALHRRPVRSLGTVSVACDS